MTMLLLGICRSMYSTATSFLCRIMKSATKCASLVSARFWVATPRHSDSHKGFRGGRTLRGRWLGCCIRYAFETTCVHVMAIDTTIQIGLLSKDNDAQLPFAYRLYKSELDESVDIAVGFKQTFCRPVPIQFIGVWCARFCCRFSQYTQSLFRDTVASIGLLTRKTLPFVTNNTTIRTFRHALALDERRAKFRASYYQHTAPDIAGDVQRPSTYVKPSMIRRTTKTLMRSFSNIAEELSGSTKSKPSFWKRFSQEGQVTLRRGPASPPTIIEPSDNVFTTDVREVWFAGGHAGAC